MDLRDTIGHEIDIIPAMTASPAVTDSIIQTCKAILERLGATPADPDDSALTILGQRDDVASLISTASVVALLRELLLLNTTGKTETLPYFGEFWIDEAGIQAQYWTSVVTGTGAVTRQYSAPYVEVILNCPAGADTANLYSIQRWFVAPDTYGINTIARTFNLEFEAKFTSVANLENTGVFLGVSTRRERQASNNIIGFILAADTLTSLTDNDATETTADASAGTTITNWVKYKMQIYSGGVKFYTNETLRTTHITNLPDQSMYLNFYSITEAAVAGSIELGKIRTWYSDEV